MAIFWTVNDPPGHQELKDDTKTITDTIIFKDINPGSSGGSFMVQKMAVTSPIPVFQGLSSNGMV